MARWLGGPGIPNLVEPNGGSGVFPLRDQPMATRDGTLAVLATDAMDACCGGESDGCCADPACDHPFPDTATGFGGVQDLVQADRWPGPGADPGAATAVFTPAPGS